MTKKEMKQHAEMIIDSVVIQGANLYSLRLKKKISKKTELILDASLRNIQNNAYAILREDSNYKVKKRE